MSRASLELLKIAQSWPADPFRVNIQLKIFLESLASHPKLSEKQVKAMNALKRGDLQKKYALSAATLRPASMPEHYSRLKVAFEQSSKGIGRPWWKIFLNIW